MKKQLKLEIHPFSTIMEGRVYPTIQFHPIFPTFFQNSQTFPNQRFAAASSLALMLPWQDSIGWLWVLCNNGSVGATHRLQWQLQKPSGNVNWVFKGFFKGLFRKCWEGFFIVLLKSLVILWDVDSLRCLSKLREGFFNPLTLWED